MDKNLEIANGLENIALAREAVAGALIDIDRAIAELRDIINSDPMEGLYKRDVDVDARELSGIDLSEPH